MWGHYSPNLNDVAPEEIFACDGELENSAQLCVRQFESDSDPFIEEYEIVSSS